MTDSFTGKDIREFRTSLDLSTREFATAFGLSQSNLVKIENGKLKDKKTLEYLELISTFPRIAIWHVEKHGSGLHGETKHKLLNRLKMNIVSKEEWVATIKAALELSEVPWGRDMLMKLADKLKGE